MKSFNFLKFLNIIKNPMVHSKRSLSFVYILFIDENKFNRTKNTFWQFWIRGGPWDGSKRHRRKCWHVKAYATYDMHVTLRWLKIRTVQFFFNFSSKYPSRVKTLRWLTFFSSKTLRWLKIRIIFGSNPISLRILSHLGVFELKKVSHLKVLTRDGYFELKLKRNWTVRILSHLKVTCICLHV